MHDLGIPCYLVVALDDEIYHFLHDWLPQHVVRAPANFTTANPRQYASAGSGAMRHVSRARLSTLKAITDQVPSPASFLPPGKVSSRSPSVAGMKKVTLKWRAGMYFGFLPSSEGWYGGEGGGGREGMNCSPEQKMSCYAVTECNHIPWQTTETHCQPSHSFCSFNAEVLLYTDTE